MRQDYRFMKPAWRAALLLLCACLLPRSASALVNYDTGQRQIKGVQLLQDYNDPNAFYYVPQFPRLSTREDGTFEFLCLKYVSSAGGASGGLFHALVEFTLPPDVVLELEKELKKQVPAARIVGPVPLLPAGEGGEEGMGSFQVVSAVLADKEKGGFATRVITSGKAPLSPNSKAVVAAVLSPQGATLLWDSLSGPTSDVSVSINAYYEAAVQGYNAKITADVSAVYEHFSRVVNVQKDFTRRQLRNVVDDMQRTGTLKVEVFDRTAGTGLKASDMDGILQAVTGKLTELMFDQKNGWAAEPQRETAVETEQIQGRQDRGWFARTFLGAEDTKYYTDDQYVLKKRQDIRRSTFTLTLAKNSTLRVPVNTSGNLGGLYSALGRDPRYFRVVDLADPAFEFRPVHFQVDGEFLDSFNEAVNFVTVNVRKVYGGDQPTFSRSLVFSGAEVAAGKGMQEVSFPRLGRTGADWVEYEYQVRWSLRDAPTVSVPAEPDRWIRSRDAVVALAPPFTRRVVEIEADRQLFKDRRVATAVVEFATLLANKPRIQRRTTLRANDADSVRRVAVYHDRDTPVGLRVSWYSPERGQQGERLRLLDSDFLYLTPPALSAQPSATAAPTPEPPTPAATAPTRSPAPTPTPVATPTPERKRGGSR